MVPGSESAFVNAELETRNSKPSYEFFASTGRRFASHFMFNSAMTLVGCDQRLIRLVLLFSSGRKSIEHSTGVLIGNRPNDSWRARRTARSAPARMRSRAICGET